MTVDRRSFLRRAGLAVGGAAAGAVGAGALVGAERIPAAMLFVRNPTGISHSPAEWASEDDCLAGVEALAEVLANLSSVPK